MNKPSRRVPVRWLDRAAYDQMPPEQRLQAARTSPGQFRSSHDLAVARIRDMAATIRKDQPVTDIHAPVLAVEVSITGDDDRTLTERVELAVADFAVSDLQAAAFWEEADPDTYARFADGGIKVEDLSRSALRIRAFLYAITRAKLTDSRIRAQMQVTDLSVTLDAIQQLAAALEAIDPGDT